MTRVSPAVGRIVFVLNFFAEHPQQAFTLTQIVRSLKLSRATCHALLVGLTEGGYLYRNPDKSYVLGPAFLALARNAEQHVSPLDVARQEMRALADELNVVTAALFLEGDEIVVRERAASLAHLGWAPPPGQRYPVYPWGNVFMVASTAKEIEAWMDRVAPETSTDERQETQHQIDFGREHGYIFAVHRSGRGEHPLLVGPEGSRVNPGRFLSALEPDQFYDLQFFTGAVMDQHGQVAFALALYGFTRTYKGSEIAVVGERLKETCDRLTTFTAGKRPQPHLVVGK